MAQTSVIPSQKDRRIRLTHHLLTLEDGHEVGVSVGGRGVPLVFMHGLALSRRAYLRMLSRIAGLGFLIIAIDAAGHGDTRNLPRMRASSPTA
jgi:pimeloyl-ACP methyl ester carboxylesterase